MTPLQRLNRDRSAIYAAAGRMSETMAQFRRTGDPKLVHAADRIADAYGSLMDAGSDLRAAIKLEKESRNGDR